MLPSAAYLALTLFPWYTHSANNAPAAGPQHAKRKGEIVMHSPWCTHSAQGRKTMAERTLHEREVLQDLCV